MWSTCLGSTVEVPVVAIRTAWFNNQNPTFSPHSVFICFLWIWKGTTIINILFFITEAGNVYCAVRTESLSTMQENFKFQDLYKAL